MSTMQEGFFVTPNSFVDSLMPRLDGNEYKVVMFIWRKTKGWHKDADAISYSQFEKGTGISETCLRRVLDALEGMGLIERMRRVADNGGVLATIYRLIMPHETQGSPPAQSVEAPTPPTGETISYEDSLKTEQKTAPPAMIALLLSLGISEAEARQLGMFVVKHSRDLTFVQAWCADIKRRGTITRPAGFLRAMAKSGAWPAAKTPPESGGFAWADYDAVRLRGDAVNFRNLTRHSQRSF